MKPGSAEVEHPLVTHLREAVPVEIKRLQAAGGPTEEQQSLAVARAQEMLWRGNVLLFGSGREEGAGPLAEPLTECLAVLAFAVGGWQELGLSAAVQLEPGCCARCGDEREVRQSESEAARMGGGQWFCYVHYWGSPAWCEPAPCTGCGRTITEGELRRDIDEGGLLCGDNGRIYCPECVPGLTAEEREGLS